MVVFYWCRFWVKSVILRLVICVLVWCWADWLVLYCFCYSMWGLVDGLFLVCCIWVLLYFWALFDFVVWGLVFGDYLQWDALFVRLCLMLLFIVVCWRFGVCVNFAVYKLFDWRFEMLGFVCGALW